MSDTDDPSVLITPPPGIALPKSTADAEASSGEAHTAKAEFITMPPGITDSGTHRVATPRQERPKAEERADEIVLFPTSPGAPAVNQSPQWRLVLPNGAGVKPLDGAVFLGRNPALTAEHPNAELLSLTDPAKSLSKTHALLEVEDGQLWAHDLDSTNGVFVVPEHGDAVEVEPGTRVLVPAGAVLEFGDYVIGVEFN